MIQNLQGLTYDKVAVGLGKLLSFDSRTTTGQSAGVAIPVRDRTYQAVVTGAGAVSATVQIQGSHDGTHWVNIGSALSLSGTNSATAGLASTDMWPIVRYDLTAVSASSTVTFTAAV